MEKLSRLVLLTLAVTWMISSPATAQDQSPFALVELFTSQGCSSCPQADRYLSQIIAEADQQGQNIIALSFHVDYWNRLGWKDPYSSSTFTDRQYTYARAWNSANVYTPQMVINGQTEFVGGNRSTGRTEIARALKQPARKSIEIQKLQPVGGTLNVSYQVRGDALFEVDIYAALVEKGLTTRVGRGENGGRRLQHDNVVRSFVRQEQVREGVAQIQLELPTDLVRENAGIVLFTQLKDQGMIDGATFRQLEIE